MEYVHPHGAEDVRSAASSMRAAADDIRNAASTISEAMRAHQAFLASWLEEYRLIVQPPPEPAPKPRDPATQPGEHEWHSWKGGFCPFGIDDPQVWIKRLNGEVERGYAHKIEWRHYKDRNFVIGWAL